MARYKWMRDRVENWAAWKVRQEAGCGRYASVDLTDPTPAATDPYADTPVRPNEEDAWEIDAAVRVILLPTEVRATVECHYLSRYTLGQKLDRLHISKSALYDRLDRFDGLLVRHFDYKQAGQRAERARVEGLLAKGRPA